MVDKEKINSYLVEATNKIHQLVKTEHDISRILEFSKLEDLIIEASKELDKDLYD